MAISVGVGSTIVSGSAVGGVAVAVVGLRAGNSKTSRRSSLEISSWNTELSLGLSASVISTLILVVTSAVGRDTVAADAVSSAAIRALSLSISINLISSLTSFFGNALLRKLNEILTSS